MTSKTIFINQKTLDFIKSSREEAIKFFKQNKILGWPKVVTPEPGKHYLVPNT